MNKRRLACAAVVGCMAAKACADTDCFPDMASAAKAVAGAVVAQDGSEAASGLTLSVPADPQPASGAVAAHAPAATGKPNEARIRALETRFRCLVCQNETIADSTADLAADLRGKIREQVAQGLSDDQIRDYMTARYGDFVLYEPPFKPVTWLLWVGPFLLLLLGFVTLFRRVVERRAIKAHRLSDLERQRAQHLLEDDR